RAACVLPSLRYSEYSTGERQRGLMATTRVSRLPRRAVDVASHRLRLGLKRVWLNSGQLIQIPIAATAAYAFCVYVLGHPYPFLAGAASGVGIDPVARRRLRRALQVRFA